MAPTSVRPGLLGFRLTPAGGTVAEWSRLEETWARAGALGVFDAAWVSDHLSDAARDWGGAAWESLTMIAALAHHVPGAWLGVAVLSNTFRHPAVLAKQATVLDNLTGGRFVLGLGAGWHVGEHQAFGVPLPEPVERFDRLESALSVLSALFSDEARSEPGVTLEDAFYPLRNATNLPPTAGPGGPPIWLGVGKRRGIQLAARFASGWIQPGNRPGDVAYLRQQRDRFRAALEAAGRNPDDFTFAAQVACGTTAESRRQALDTSRALLRAGAGHVVLGIPASEAPEGIALMAHEVAEPLRAEA